MGPMWWVVYVKMLRTISKCPGNGTDSGRAIRLSGDSFSGKTPCFTTQTHSYGNRYVSRSPLVLVGGRGRENVRRGLLAENSPEMLLPCSWSATDSH